jgi:DNA-binding beta-propeller fold protein YncE/transposase-like protein
VPRHTLPYPEEFRREAVRLAKLGGKPRWKLAKELGITEVTLRTWLRQDQAEEEARGEAGARARCEGEENAPSGARGQVALRPDSGVGGDPPTASEASSPFDRTAGSQRRGNVEAESAPRDEAAHREQRREVAEPGGARGRLRDTPPGRMTARRTRSLLVAAGVILSATVAAMIAIAITTSGRVATTATTRPGPPATTTATESVVPRPAIAVPGYPDAVAMGRGQVWVADAADDTLSRLDPGSGRVVGGPIIVGAFPDAIAIGQGSVWVANADDNTVTRLDATTGQVVGEPIPVGAFPDGIAVGDGSVWVANANNNTVARLDARTGKLIGRPIPVGAHPHAVAVASGFVWVSNLDGDTVSRIDASSGTVVGPPIRVGERPISIAEGQGSVWVANADANTISPLGTDPGTVAGG